MVPTKERNHTGILLTYKNENILVDCGEGIQRQFRIAGVSPTKITKLLITHWHGDHILGIAGLMQTLAANEYSKVLEVYGPRGTKEFFAKLWDFFVPYKKVGYVVRDIDAGVFFEDKELLLESAMLRHGVPCLAYKIIEKGRRKINLGYLKRYGLQKHPILKQLQEGKDIEWKGKKISVCDATSFVKGKSVAILLDTQFCDAAIEIAKGSDLLIAEATYSSDFEDKAIERKHLTSGQSALIAKKANVKKLILTHFSQRYKELQPILNDAKKIFHQVSLAKDFMVVEV